MNNIFVKFKDYFEIKNKPLLSVQALFLKKHIIFDRGNQIEDFNIANLDKLLFELNERQSTIVKLVLTHIVSIIWDSTAIDKNEVLLRLMQLLQYITHEKTLVYVITNMTVDQLAHKIWSFFVANNKDSKFVKIYFENQIVAQYMRKKHVLLQNSMHLHF